MSGYGLISIRIPRTLVAALLSGTRHADSADLHGRARLLLSCLKDFSPDDLILLPEPPREMDSPRISLYVGRYRTVLSELTARTQLSKSSIFRRIAYGFFVTRSVRFVQHRATKDWQLVCVQNTADKNQSQFKEKDDRAAS